jgi:hypothetical protein
MAFRGFAGGFASGVTAGSEAASRAQKAKIDAENQEYLQTQREEERQTKAQLAAAAAPAQTTEGQGLMVQGPDGKAFYIPSDATDAASAYTRAGYNVAEAPTRYSEVTAGGKTLKQAEISPEHAELGYNPLSGLQQQYDAGRMQRLKDVGIARGRPELAAAYGQLGLQELQQKAAEGQIALQPGQLALQQSQVREAQRKEAQREAIVQVSTHLATGNVKGLEQLVNDSHPDPNGGRTQITKDDKGPGYTVNFLDKDGNITGTHKAADQHQLAGDMISRLDPDKALAWHDSERKFQHEKQQGEIAMAKLTATLKSMGGRNEASAYALGQAKEFDKKRNDIIDDLEAGRIKPEGNRTAEQVADSKINRLAIRYGSGHGIAEQKPPAAGSRLQQMTGAEAAELRDRAEARLKQYDKNFPKLDMGTPAGRAEHDRMVNEEMENMAGGATSQRGVTKTGGNVGVDMKIPASFNTPAAPAAGGGRSAVSAATDPLDAMVQQRRGGVVINTPQRSIYSPLNGKTFATKEDARAALEEHGRRTGALSMPGSPLSVSGLTPREDW